MRVFVLGATGFIGSGLVESLIQSGHEVIGLARSDKSAEKLISMGAKAHRGSLDDLASIKAGASQADGVIHLAFDNSFNDFEGAIKADLAAIQTIGDTLEGTDKPFVATSVTTMLAPTGQLGTESMKGVENTPGYSRTASEEAVIALAKRHVRSSVVRLAPAVHDETTQGFASVVAEIAQAQGVSAYVDDGENQWPAVHRTDAVALFQKALESAPAGSVLHAVAEEGIPFKTIAEAVGRKLNVPVTSIAADEASAHFTWLTPFVTFDNPVSSAQTQALLDWKPTGKTLLEDIETKF